MLYSLIYAVPYLWKKIAGASHNTADTDEPTEAWARQRRRFQEAIAQAQRATSADNAQARLRTERDYVENFFGPGRNHTSAKGGVEL